VTARRRQNRQRADERRAYERDMIKVLYPALASEQVGCLLDNARHVRLLDGRSLAAALGR
jgi:hypothetical protein